MAVQLTLERCGVVLLDRSQGRTAPGPQPQRGPHQVTDCGSETPAMTRGDQSRATSHQKPLRIMQWNAEGIQNKKIELQHFLKENNVDICCAQETHLNSTHRFFVRGYELYRQDRLNRSKGGVLILVKNTFSSVELHRSGDSDTETITVKIILPDRHITVCNLYCPPDKMIQLPTPPQDNNWITVGDFNSHSPSWGYRDLDIKGEEVEEWITSNRLVLINKSSDPPTFYSRVWHSTSTPDLAIATDNIQKITEREVCAQLGGSDHRPVILTIQKQVIGKDGKLPPSWNYKKADWDLFRKLSDSNTSSIDVSSLNVDRAANLFTLAILSAASKSIPRGRRHNYKPFWTSELDNLHKQLSDAREQMEQKPTPQNIARHKLLKETFEQKKTDQTQQSWYEKTASLNLERDTQKLWQLTNVLNDDNRRYGKITLQKSDDFVTGKAAANVFAKAYEAVSTVNVPQDRIREVRQETKTLQAELKSRASPCMTDNLTMSELEIAIKKLKQKKAPGADRITNEMLKHLGHKAKKILLQIFNLSWHSGKFPSMWKEAHIRPILKKGKDRSKPESYRPVSLLSCTGKLLERIINTRLLWHLESNSLLTPTQTGYRQHHSTEDQLAYFTQDIEDAFQEKKKTLAVFFDLSKAFDTVWKKGLLLKLLRMNVCGKMYNWLHNFLFQRTARVKLDGTLSNLVKMREGVPQGGVVSATLFLVYINDIVSSVPKHVSNTLHADDFAVWSSETSTVTATYRIQTTVNNVSDWTKKWALNINTLKTTATLFSLSTLKEKINLKLDSQQVPQVDTPTFLGVTLDTRLSWKPHIETVEQRTVKKLSLMKKLAGTSWGANAKILKQVYTGTVRPVAEYASTSWMTASKTSKSKLDKVQNAGLRVILGAMKTTPIKELEKTADLQPLEARREYKALSQAEKAKRLPSHPLHGKLQNQTKNRLKRQSLNHIVKNLQETKSDILEPDGEKLQPTKWMPRRLVPKIMCDVPGLEEKGKQLPALQKSLAQEMIQERYPPHSWIHVYTDGSAHDAVRNAGSGVFIRFPNKPPTNISIPAGERSSNYRAEVQALITAAQHLIELDIGQQTNFAFLTDSLSALQALQSGPTDSATQQLQDNLYILSQRSNVVLQWIPAHVGIAGNEAADKLAKQGSKLPQPHPPTTYREAKTLLINSLKADWRTTNDNYNPEKDPINQLTRQGQTTIFRLRTGHCGLRKHMRKMGLVDTASCQCGAEEQTPAHILQTCPHLEELRRKVWPSDTSFQEKLWGHADDLRKTEQFISMSGLRI